MFTNHSIDSVDVAHPGQRGINVVLLVLRQVYVVGLSLTMALLASPAELVTPRMRALLVAYKPELLEFLRRAERTTVAVIG